MNNGMLILADVPKISRDIARSLDRQQSVRAARFRAWTPDGTDR